MGHRLSAHIFYGFDLGSSEDRTDEQHALLPQWYHDEVEWEDALAMRMGWQPTPYPEASDPLRNGTVKVGDFWRGEPPEAAASAFRNTPEYREWSDNMDVKRNLIAEFGVHLDHYGYDFDGCCVSVKDSEQGCDYGAEPISSVFAPRSIINEWNGQLTRFCSALEITVPKSGFGWHICATWG